MAEEIGYMKPLPVPLKASEHKVLKDSAFDSLDDLDKIEEEKRAAMAEFRQRADAIETRLIDTRQEGSNLKKLLKILDDADKLDAEKHEASAGYKARTEAEDAKLTDTRRSLRTNTTLREVWCIEIINADNAVEVHRTDVKKNHPDRIVSVRERTLFDSGANGAAPADSSLAQIALDEAEAMADADAEAQANGAELRRRTRSKKTGAESTKPARARTRKTAQA